MGGLSQSLPDVLSFLLILSLSFASSEATQIEILNNCTYTIWAAANPGGGKQLKLGETWTLNNIIGSGRIWGRTNCAYGLDGRLHCEGGDCDGVLECQANGRAPNTVAEYSINEASNGDDVFYISVVEGFNIPMEFSPQDMSSSSDCSQVSKCAADVNEACPTELRDPGGCNNPCTVFHNSQFCCTSGTICEPTSYSKFFEDLCRVAFTYPADYGQRRTCPTGTDYSIVFCPTTIHNTGNVISRRRSRNETGANATRVTIKNNCPRTIWPATLTGDQKPQLSTTGFELISGASSSFYVPSPWSRRFWARSRCSNNDVLLTCITGDCGSGRVECNGADGAPPATLVEITIAANGGQDYYDVSNVDGFNLPVSVAPQGGTGECKRSTCPADINAAYPAELQLKADGGDVVGCQSACTVFNEPEYCCTGDFNRPETCQPTDYSRFFEDKCPQAYSYAYDDKNSTFTCSGRPNYLITFCPS